MTHKFTFPIPRTNQGRVTMLDVLKEDKAWVTKGTKSYKLLNIKIKALTDINNKYIETQKRRRLH